MIIRHIGSNDELSQLCEELASKPYIAIDTEFVKEEREYHHKLCLIQICYGDEVAIIDATIPTLDLRSLKKLMEDWKIVKVLHAASQDLAMLQRVLNSKMIGPVFDTQVAALFYGARMPPGYAALVSEYLSIELDKSLQFSRWQKRPLSAAHYRYAAADAFYLWRIYEGVRTRLSESGKMPWFVEDMGNIGAEIVQNSWEKEALRFVKPGPLLLSDLLILHILEWREKVACATNKAKSLILSDAKVFAVVEAYRRRGIGIDEVLVKESGGYCSGHDWLSKLREQRGLEATGVSNAIMAAILAFFEGKSETIAQDLERATLLLASQRWDDDQEIVEQVRHLRAVLDYVSALYDIAPMLLANRRDLITMARGHRNAKLEKGWRHDIWQRGLRELCGKRGDEVEVERATVVPLPENA